MISRILSKKLSALARKFPVVAVTGPRQSGKTTLAKTAFPRKVYVSLEDLDTREYAHKDPRGFLRDYSQGAILDEIQRAPGLFSYLQTVVDQNPQAGKFILTGSQQFLLMQNLSQTLAGRVAVLNLLPFSLEELKAAGKVPGTVEKMIYDGFYPRIYDKKLAPEDWYPDYLQTYVERDVRLIKNIDDLSLFQKFLKLCAGRTGQLLNLSSLGDECGVKHNTARSWIGILEASFIVYLLRPHHQSFNKRVVKTPKLYFYDTGLACSLLEIEHERQLKTHPLRGCLFETAMMTEMVKYRLNRGRPCHFYFWRDKSGHEIDCILDRAGRLVPIEIKSGETVTGDFFKNLIYWREIAGQKTGRAYLIFGGTYAQRRAEANVVSWQDPHILFKELR